MNVVIDGDAMLGGVQVDSIGCDTVILFDSASNTIYICGHLKDYKPGNGGAFEGQMAALLKIVNTNKDKKCIFMADANTQFVVSGKSLFAYSKDATEMPLDSISYARFDMEDGVVVSSVSSKFPTSNKARGVHTAQLDKSFKKITAVIDHVLVFNGEPVVSTAALTLAVDSAKLTLIKDSKTPTTSPISIADHALVVSTTVDNNSYGTLNIKGGDTADKAWAEFIPLGLIEFFDSEAVQKRLTELLVEAFPGLELAKVKKSLSKPRMRIFDINLSNDVAPSVAVTGTTITVLSAGKTFILTLSGDTYVCEQEDEVWLPTLLSDLNIKKEDKGLPEPCLERRRFFIDIGHKLLNYWAKVQNDTADLGGGANLSSKYAEWEKLSTNKVPISEMVKQARELYPNLKVLSIQEFPRNMSEAQPLISEIEAAGACKIYLMSSDLDKCQTRGGIAVFLPKSGGGGRRSLKRGGSRRRSFKRTNL